MESQSYKTFISELKSISKERCRLRKFGWIFSFDSLLTWMTTDAVFSTIQLMISWWVNFFLSLFITFKANVRMSIIPSLCSFFLAVHLEWCLNLSTDTKSVAICIFANLCVPLYLVGGSNFLQLGSTFCQNA